MYYAPLIWYNIQNPKNINMFFGAHVSIAGGIPNAPLNAEKIGCEVFQIFTRSPRGGAGSPCTPAIAKNFKDNCLKAGQKEWYVHTPYFVNYASGNSKIKYGSISVVREELERASMLGAKYLMTHLGSYRDLGDQKGFTQLIEGIDATLKGYTGETQFLIEISANGIGHTFETLAEIIHHTKLKKYNIGICYDTQHGFASGYDIRTVEALSTVLKKFDQTIGLDKLKMSHCNDSKVEFNSLRDRHEHIGKGKIGKSGFEAIVNNKKLKNLNLILETEHDLIEEDLSILKKIRNNK